MNENEAAPPPATGAPSRPPLGRRLAAPVGTLALLAGAFAYVGAVDPGEPGHYPVCPLLQLTGVYCPGCGGLRTAHALAHGDVPAAMASNALAVAAIAGFAAFLAVWLYGAALGRRTVLRLRPVHWWLAGGATIVFTVARNTPFASALAP